MAPKDFNTIWERVPPTMNCPKCSKEMDYQRNFTFKTCLWCYFLSPTICCNFVWQRQYVCGGCANVVEYVEKK